MFDKTLKEAFIQKSRQLIKEDLAKTNSNQSLVYTINSVWIVNSYGEVIMFQGAEND